MGNDLREEQHTNDTFKVNDMNYTGSASSFIVMIVCLFMLLLIVSNN